jgi:copper chaperone CopZ
MQSVTLHIEGMSCAHCLNAVNSALHELPGVAVKQVQIGRAEVELPADITPEALVAAVAEAGYRATAVAQP